MEKSNIHSFAEKTLKKQRAASEKARLKYEKTGDPKIVIKFILDDFSGETQKEKWVLDVLAEWHREKRKDLFSKLYSPKGRPEAPYSRKLANFIFVDRIDRYKADNGGQLKEAIIREMERQAGGNISEIDEKVFQKIKNDYERYKRAPMICRVVEGEDYYEIKIYASKITLGDRPIARGTAKYKFPKK